MKTLLIIFLIIGSTIVIGLLIATVVGIELIRSAFDYLFDGDDGDSDDKE